jgi:hypothetical protein
MVAGAGLEWQGLGPSVSLAGGGQGKLGTPKFHVGTLHNAILIYLNFWGHCFLFVPSGGGES